MKKIQSKLSVIVLATILIASISSVSVLAARHGKVPKDVDAVKAQICVDADEDGICDNFVDEDEDGICDEQNKKVFKGGKEDKGNKPEKCVDADEDGVCDNFVDEDEDGICDEQNKKGFKGGKEEDNRNTNGQTKMNGKMGK